MNRSSSTNVSASASGGVGFLGLLTIAFIVLKLTGFIDWSWWAVTAPLWGAWLLVMVLALVGLLVWLVLRAHGRRKDARAAAARQARA